MTRFLSAIGPNLIAGTGRASLNSKEPQPMIIMKLAMAGLLGMVAVSALAQAPGLNDSLPRSGNASNIVPADTRSNVAPTLPSPGLSANAGPHDYLRVARTSLAAGRTGEAQQALEMAETRTLDGVVLSPQAGAQDGNKSVTQIRDALHALGQGDRARAMDLIDQALAG
jgi:hypothetical protein